MRYFAIILMVLLPTITCGSDKDDTRAIITEKLEQAIQNQTESLDPIKICFNYWPKTLSNKMVNTSKINVDDLDLTVSGDRFTALIPYKNGKTVTLSGTISKMINLPVLKHTVQGTIQADDITFLRFPANKVTTSVAKDVGDLIGKEIVGGIQANQPISLIRLKTPIAVKRGQIIDVAYATSRLSVSTRAKAQQNASIGDEVSLEVLSQAGQRSLNNQTNRIIHAKVTGIGRAEVGHA